MTLAIGWLHDGGDTVETWLHQAGDWQARFGVRIACDRAAQRSRITANA